TEAPNDVVAAIRANGKKVVTFIGYSGLEYEDKAAMLSAVRKALAGYDPKKTIVNMGATPDGIGAAYEVAKELGFETTGIVSSQAKEYGGLSKSMDRGFYVEDPTWGGFNKEAGQLNPTSAAMVAASDDVIAIGGGEVGRDEMLAAVAAGKNV